MIDHTAGGDVGAGTPEPLHYLHDALGSVAALTDASGSVVESYTYDPYGPTYIEDPLTGERREASLYDNPFAWTGQRYDAGVRLYHFPQRTYSPRLGRWLQRDPLGYVDGVNLYEYARSMPTFFVDPFGLAVTPDLDPGGSQGEVGGGIDVGDDDDPNDDEGPVGGGFPPPPFGLKTPKQVREALEAVRAVLEWLDESDWWLYFWWRAFYEALKAQEQALQQWLDAWEEANRANREDALWQFSLGDLDFEPYTFPGPAVPLDVDSWYTEEYAPIANPYINEWSEHLEEDLLKGMAATADGFLPFINPFSWGGCYNVKRDPGTRWARIGGMLARYLITGPRSVDRVLRYITGPPNSGPYMSPLQPMIKGPFIGGGRLYVP